MLNLNTLFGFVLAIGATAVGVHAYDTYSTKTNTPTPAVTDCVQECLRVKPTDACVRACTAAPAAPVVSPPPVVTVSPKQIQPVLVVPADVKPCPEKKFVLVKAHHHKSKVSHHHKSKSHHSHHHGGHHHGGHHHGGHHHGGHHHGGHHHGAPHTGPPQCP